MGIDVRQFFELFLQESTENLEQMEAGLLLLQGQRGDREELNGIFRAAHSIKGSAGTFGLKELVRFTHELESLLDRLRNGAAEADAATVELLLKATDVLRGMLGQRGEAVAGMEEVLEELKAVAGPAAAEAKAEAKTAGGAKSVYQVTFRPKAEAFETGANPLLFLRNLGELGRVLEVELETGGLPAPAELEVGKSYLGWRVRLESEAGEAAIREVFDFIEDVAEVRVAAERAAAAGPVVMKAAAREAASIRVSTEKVDHLIDLVGEMVIAHSVTAGLVGALEKGAAQDTLAKLRESLEQLERSTRDLHERVMGVRMLPVGGLFGRFQRVVHDLSQKTGKKIVLRTEGEETEVDRSLLEQLSDPLTHLVRNAADHGLETAAERRAAGKAEESEIVLRARHEGGAVVVEIEDDGRGLNLEAIRAKAERQGLVAAGAELDEDEVAELIFEPGFSTKEEATEFSGRGVGMDVVRRNVAAMSGTITLDSHPGEGLVVRIRLPLTLAILDGLAVEVGGQTYVLPITVVAETAAVEASEIKAVADRGEVIVLRGEALPVLRLERLFGLKDSEGVKRRLAMVIEQDERKVAVLVDEIVGQQQFVIKSLEKHFRRVEGAMGATILGDGRAALILDATSLLSHRSSKTPAARPLVA